MTASAQIPTGVSNGDLIRWAFERLNERDVDTLKQAWTSETEERFPDRTCHGAEEIAAYFKEAFAAISNFQIKPVTVTEQGDDVFVRWQLTGTHTGLFMGIAPTGRDVAIDGIDHFTLKDERVVSNFVVFDRVQFGEQVGLMAKDGSRADRALKNAFNARTKLLAKIRR